MLPLSVALPWIGAAALPLLAAWAARRAGARRWGRLSETLRAQLRATRIAAPDAPAWPTLVDDLPAPVQRYFRVALKPDARLVTAVGLVHRGQFNVGEMRDRWRPFRSHQQVQTHRPGFVWDGEIQWLPGLPVHVHDAYIDGEGLLHPALLGLLTLAERRDHAALAAGELMRFLAEAAWYPTMLLPGQGVTWAALDDASARATLTDGILSVSLDMHFGDDGLIALCRADARGRTVKGRMLPTPWEGRWSDFQWQGGQRVPMRGEAAWRLPDGDRPYWRGTIESLVYETVA